MTADGATGPIARAVMVCINGDLFYALPETVGQGWAREAFYTGAISSRTFYQHITSAYRDERVLPPALGGDVTLGLRCIDGGKCHHQCETACFRRQCCAPLSGYRGPWHIAPRPGR